MICSSYNIDQWKEHTFPSTKLLCNIYITLYQLQIFVWPLIIRNVTVLAGNIFTLINNEHVRFCSRSKWHMFVLCSYQCWEISNSCHTDDEVFLSCSRLNIYQQSVWQICLSHWWRKCNCCCHLVCVYGSEEKLDIIENGRVWRLMQLYIMELFLNIHNIH